MRYECVAIAATIVRLILITAVRAVRRPASTALI